MSHYRLYLDNQLIKFTLDHLQNKLSKNLNILSEQEAVAYLFSLKHLKLEILLSEESLAEIRKLPKNSNKRKDLENLYYNLKQGKSVIRNSSVTYNDSIATYNSPDVFWNHDKKDDDLNRVKKFLIAKGNLDDFDARYIANAMLPENKINFFLTADKKSIWLYRKEILKNFKVVVKLPTELRDQFK